jgi:cell division protease FtsH
VWGQVQRVERLAYSDFVRQLEAGNVAEVAVSSRLIHGRLKVPTAAGNSAFEAVRVEPDFAELLARYGVVFRGEVESTLWRDILSWILPVVFFVAVWFFVFRQFAERQGMGTMMSVGKSRTKVFMEREVKVTFDDVAGVDEAKDELKEVVAFLKEPQVYGRLGARIAKGILLVGPPGTGKTLLARAVAGQAAVPFFSINGSEFVELFVGIGGRRRPRQGDRYRAQNGDALRHGAGTRYRRLRGGGVAVPRRPERACEPTPRVRRGYRPGDRRGGARHACRRAHLGR